MIFPIFSSKKLSPSKGIQFLAIAFIVLASLLFQPQRAAAAPDDVQLSRNDSQGITLRYRTPAVFWDSLQIDDRWYRTPKVLGTGLPWESGMPQIPVRVIWLAVPPEATVSLAGVTPYLGSNLQAVPAPVAQDSAGAGGFSEPIYLEDPTYYAGSAPFPQTFASLEGPEPFRDLRVIRLLVYPFRFLPSSGQLQSLDSMDVNVSFSGSAPQAAAFGRPAEDQFYQSLLTNWSGSARSWKAPKLPQTDLQDPWPAGDWYKIKIDASGIYHLTYNDLIAAGINPDNLDPHTLRLFNNGGEVLPKNLETARPQAPIENAIMIIGEEDGSFDPGDEIWFYGKSVHDWKWNGFKGLYQHYRNPYTDQNVYWLNVNPEGPNHLPMATLGLAAGAVLNPQYTRAYYVDERELNIVYDGYSLPQSMPDFYGDAFSGASSRNFTFSLEGVAATAPAHLTLKIRFGDTNGHTFQVSLNDTPLFTTSSTSIERDIEAGVLLAADSSNNVLQLEHLSSGIAYIDYFELEYTRDLATAPTGQIAFISPEGNGIAQYSLGGSGWTPQWIFDVTNYANVKAVQAVSFKDSSNSAAPRRYLAISAAALKSPYSISKDQRSGDEYANLRSSLSADLVVICGDAFYDAMKDYEIYRETQAPVPRQVLRVRISDIFDEYGWGLVDPAAIRDFLKTTLPLYNWVVSPLYVLFAGDGDFDYKNRLSNADANWVIPFVSGGRCTDDWFAYFGPTDNTSSFPELAVGRWPARSVEDIEILIDRLKAYETQTEYGPWQDIVTFVADDEYGEGGHYLGSEQAHTHDTEIIAQTCIPNIINLDKIYLTEYPVSYDPAGGGRRKPEAAADLMEAINDGRLLVSYMGHGNPSVWAHEHVFLQSRDIPLMNNGEKLPLFVAATCDWAFWDNALEQSMPEVMLTLPGGGAIAAMAATRVTGSNANMLLAQNFFQALFEGTGGTPLGLALMRAKSRFYVKDAGGSVSNVNSEKYHVLGDPAMKLAIPPLPVQLNTASADTLFALNQATLSGQVLSLSGAPLTSFQGIVRLQVFDTRRAIYYGYNNGPPPAVPTYYLPGNLIFRGDASVVDGAFQSTFIVPLDINYGGEGGRFSVFAYTEDISAAGANDSVVFGETSSAILDNVPPQVLVYFDNPGFQSGEKVSPQATLYIQVSDSNGVNLTGSIGHGIRATIDNQNPVDLTDAFSYDLNSHTTGRADYQFSPGELSPGLHLVEAIAWDAANNPNTAQINFEVVGSGELALGSLLNYPNPLRSSTRFTFALTEDASVTIKVFTVAGRLVKVIEGIQGHASFNYEDPQLLWDGRDAEGDLLSNGVYLYKVIAESLGGSRTEEMGKLVVMR